MKMRIPTLLLVVAASVSFWACGGGGSTTPPPAKYTIGGTVSGLSGTVVLQDNGGDNLTVNADGNFTFSTAITSGGTYKVTVSTQPSGQNCGVTNGSGIATANVTNVQVTCAALPTYTIGGTVSGLSGAGLVLEDNGGDDLSITANGSFTFATPIFSGGTYNVTVSTPPTGPLQFCMVSNGSGTANANVTNVGVACSTPTEQALYTFGNAPDGNDPTGSLVFDSSGNLYGTTAKVCSLFARQGANRAVAVDLTRAWFLTRRATCMAKRLIAPHCSRVALSSSLRPVRTPRGPSSFSTETEAGMGALCLMAPAISMARARQATATCMK